MSKKTNGLYEFGPYRLDAAQRLLTRARESVTLAPKTFDLLLILVESCGRVLTKKELMNAFWPDTFVEEANLPFQISGLRKALGDDGGQWIETLPKHGYRFTAPVARIGGQPASSRKVLPWLIAASVVLGAAAVALRHPGKPSVHNLTTIPLTAYQGDERQPSFSPDGNQVAFSWNGNGPAQLRYLRQSDRSRFGAAADYRSRGRFQPRLVP